MYSKWVDPYGSWANYVCKSLCITTKQWSFIKAICKELKIEFDGNTKEAARQFISKYIDEYYKSIKKKKAY